MAEQSFSSLILFQYPSTIFYLLGDFSWTLLDLYFTIRPFLHLDTHPGLSVYGRSAYCILEHTFFPVLIACIYRVMAMQSLLPWWLNAKR